MHAVRALQGIETKLLKALSVVYGCDEDSLPIEIDSLEIFNSPEDQRLGLVMNILSSAPSSVESIVRSYLNELKELHLGSN